MKLNYKDLIGCLGFFSLFIVFSETTCYFHEKRVSYYLIRFFSFYFFQNLKNFDIDSCIVFELGDKMLTLSSMENLIVQCNHNEHPVLALAFFTAMSKKDVH